MHMNGDDTIHILVSHMDGLARVKCGIYVLASNATESTDRVNCRYCIDGKIDPVLR